MNNQSEIRALIDAAKLESDLMDSSQSFIQTPQGMVEVKRSTRRDAPTKSETIDPSDVAVAEDPQLVALLYKQLSEIRAQKRELDDKDAAIKSILENLSGHLQYMALEPGGKPIFSLKHEASLRLRTAAIKERFPVEEYPEFYSNVTSRPLRLMS